MKKIFFLSLLLLSLLAFGQSNNDLPDKPVPPRLVNDFTGKFLTAQQVEALEQKLVAYDDSTSNQIAIVIVDDLKGYSAGDFATALGQKWGVGNKKNNNGVVILVSTGGKDGNRDVFIAPGYGLEGVITDALAGTIVDNELVPDFKTQNYYRGLNDAVDAIARAAEGRYKAPEGYNNRGKGGGAGLPTVIVLIVLVIVLIAFINGKGGGGDYASRRGYRGFTDVFPGGGWTGGGGSGGWSGGGGFGGFGGGGFGGGGAGGKW